MSNIFYYDISKQLMNKCTKNSILYITHIFINRDTNKTSFAVRNQLLQYVIDVRKNLRIQLFIQTTINYKSMLNEYQHA